MSDRCYIGVDVGTGSVRAALVTPAGKILKVSTCPIRTWNPEKDFYEQSSDDIWKSCCECIKAASESINSASIKGIGFDATCSLVCIGESDEPLSVSLSGNNEQNIILWMDHRSISEANIINQLEHEVLKYVGGKISPEMQTPKLMWLKRHLPNTWNRAKYFFDLVDFLTWKATGDDSRSLCTLVCKWTYVAGDNGAENGWNENYFSLIGLSELLENDASKIGSRVRKPGEKLSLGLTESAAKSMNLLPGTCVGAGLIDAHAGGLGLLTASAPGINPSVESKIGMICGTSTCHMVVSHCSKLVPGVWGPYFHAMLPNMYLNEAGQSATGKLLDFIVESHPAYSLLKKRLSDQDYIYDHLNKLLDIMATSKGLSSPALLAANLHIWPDFHGNRSPLADSSLMGMISGLSLTSDEEDLALKYLATVQALAYGTKHIIETLRRYGHDKLSTALMCGGLSKNKLFVQTHADVTGLPVLVPETAESVLLGSAILGAVAAREWSNLKEAVENMLGSAFVFTPSQVDKKFHLKKYKVFLKMVEDQKSYESIIKNEN